MSKIQNHDLESEKAVLAGIVKEPFKLPLVMPILKPGCFYHLPHQEVYKSILALEGRKESVDSITIVQELKKTGKLEFVGGAHFVVDLIDGKWYALDVVHHAKIVYQLFAVRELAGVGMKLYNLATEPSADPYKLLEIIHRDLSSVDYISNTNFEKVGDVVQQVIDENKKAIESGVKPGIGMGVYSVDRFHSKLKQDLGIIAARPGMGKTAYMLACAKHTAVDLGKPVLIFSLEMSTKKLVGRLMASESGVSSKDINQKTVNAGQLMSLGAGVTRLLGAPMYFDDSAGMDITQIRSKIRRAKQDFKIEEVYIDYLQLMAGDKKGNREQEVSYISRNLKMIAKEEDLPITALSQLSRKIEDRVDKKPVLSDLRESGSIEQDADWVIFLFRPEYYGMGNNGMWDEETFDGRTLETKGLLIVDCHKYREGSLFKSAVRFEGDCMRISGYGEPPSERLQENTDFLS